MDSCPCPRGTELHWSKLPHENAAGGSAASFAAAAGTMLNSPSRHSPAEAPPMTRLLDPGTGRYSSRSGAERSWRRTGRQRYPRPSGPSSGLTLNYRPDAREPGRAVPSAGHDGRVPATEGNGPSPWAGTCATWSRSRLPLLKASIPGVEVEIIDGAGHMPRGSGPMRREDRGLWHPSGSKLHIPPSGAGLGKALGGCRGGWAWLHIGKLILATGSMSRTDR